ncbi:MAG: polyprenyl synthetase family protein [Deltaproteobacteria bacterium]|nr:polyprenyl synthetase family protein [Deltaproteobacteria bacterium]
MSMSSPSLRATPESTPRAPDSSERVIASSADELIARVEEVMERLTGDASGDLTREMVLEHLATGGKRFRARLALEAGRALGAEPSFAVGWAAAVELLHNATLVHDDIQDGDTIRRGKATVWARYGIEQAINAGDFLLMLPYLAVAELDCEPAVKARLMTVLARSAVDCVRGQVYELQLKSLEEVPWQRYLRAVRGKTGALLAMAVEGSALLAGRSVDEAAAFAACFFPLGELFQMQDDVLDLYGDKGRSEQASDLYEGKVSALVVAHLERHPEETTWLRALLSAPRYATSPDDVRDAVERMRSGGALADVLGHIAAVEHETRSSPVLAAEPDLQATALQLCRMAQLPIAHLTVGAAGVEDPNQIPRSVRPCRMNLVTPSS